MSKKNTILGAHLPISGGYSSAFLKGEEIGCTTMQIFTKNNKAWFGKPITEDEVKDFKQAHRNSSIRNVVAHAGYLINLASLNNEVERLSTLSLEKELERCALLSIPHLVLHPGSHVGNGEKKGITQIAKNLTAILKNTHGNTTILLETMAGQGTSIGHTFENLRAIYEECEEKERLGICFDTCHVFAAGYDLTSQEGFQQTMQLFDDLLGLNLLKVIHLNDSRDEKGSKKDRHACIGKGRIPLSVFDFIMKSPSLSHIPKILETPVDNYKEYAAEISLLSEMLN